MKFFYSKVRKRLGLFTTTEWVVNGKDLDEVSVLVSKNKQWTDYLDIQFFYGEYLQRVDHKYRTYESLLLEIHPETTDVSSYELDEFVNDQEGYDALLVTEIMKTKYRGKHYIFTKTIGDKVVGEIEYICEGRSKAVDLDFGVKDERSMLDKLLGKKRIIKL